MTELLARLPPEALAALLHDFTAFAAAWLTLWTALVVVALAVPPRARPGRSTLI